MKRNLLLTLALALAASWLGGCHSRLDLAENLVPATVDQDPALPQVRITVAGRQRAVHVRTFGNPQNPVLLVLHGSLGDHRSLLPFQALADSYYVVMWDQRGNGLSERVGHDEIGQQYIIEEIDQIRERYSPGRPVTLMGHSFGAMYTALYLSARPQHVAQAVLLEPAGLNGTTMQVAMDNSFKLNLLDGKFVERLWQNMVLSATDHAELDYKATLLLFSNEMQYHCDPANKTPIPVWRPGAYLDLIRGQQMTTPTGQYDFDFAYGLQAYPQQVLLVGGECSGIGYNFQRDHIAPLFGTPPQVAFVPQAGLRLHVEQFSTVLSIVKGYLHEYQ